MLGRAVGYLNDFVFDPLGTHFWGFLNFLGGSIVLFFDTLEQLLTPPLYTGLVIQQVREIGIRSIVLVAVTAASTGMVMALQLAYGFSRFGGELYVPKIVALSLVRELGPVFAGLMLAARVGAGIAAEVGSMKVTEQIDAMKAMGTSPIRKIVIPRLLAMLLVIPLLTCLADVVGILGGLVVCIVELNFDATFYLKKVIESVLMRDFLEGIAKTFFFGIAIVLTSCYYGFKTKGGTQGVGQSTTQAVVVSSIIILVGDFFLTKLFISF
jgi:phospholipid/cholesterol/gamma-HCH transport system permease protein